MARRVWIASYIYKLNIRGYCLTDCSELMIDTSTHTPTVPPIFKCLYLHNVWCLHQHQPNSDGKTKAVLVGHGKSHWKACILPFLLGLGLEAQDLSFIYSWVSWEELVVALCQLNRIVIQSSLEPVYLNDSLKRKQAAKQLFHSNKAFR